MHHWLHGAFTALATPFCEERIDFQALERLIAWQIVQGVDGLVVCSATGEFSSLTAAEQQEIMVCARRTCGEKYPIVAAVGTNATATTLEQIRSAERSGASALLLRTPYYNRPSQDGLVAHIRAAAGATGLEIVLDSDPDRCGVEISLKALEDVAGCANVIGVLERRGDLVRCNRIARARGWRFLRLTGAAETIPAYLLAGGCGAVTGLGNVAPGWLCRLSIAARSGLYAQAQLLQERLTPLIEVLAQEPEPALIKQALSIMHPGFSPVCRPPLASPPHPAIERMRQAINDVPRPPALAPMERIETPGA